MAEVEEVVVRALKPLLQRIAVLEKNSHPPIDLTPAIVEILGSLGYPVAAPGTAALIEAAKPWADFHGDLPDYDHPLRCVFESGIEYAVELLANELGVGDYEVCDGTEEFDGDLGGTLINIVLAAMPTDAHGDPIHPKELSALSAQRSLAEREADGLRAIELMRAYYAADDARNECSECENEAVGALRPMFRADRQRDQRSTSVPGRPRIDRSIHIGAGRWLTWRIMRSLRGSIP